MQGAIATPTKPAVLQHPDAVGNAAAVAANTRETFGTSLSPVQKITIHNTTPISSDFGLVFLPFPLIIFTLPAREVLWASTKGPQDTSPSILAAASVQFFTCKTILQMLTSVSGALNLTFSSLVLSGLSSSQSLLRISSFIVFKDNKIICLLGVFVQLNPVCLVKD